jgi:hypothetical protein
VPNHSSGSGRKFGHWRSIEGVGTFDGIVLSGIVAAYSAQKYCHEAMAQL